MAKVTKETQFTLSTPNEKGAGAKVFGTISKAGINIKAFCAYGMENQANFILLTENPDKAREILNTTGYKITINEVVTIVVADRVGRAHELTGQLAQAGIDIQFCYATSTGPTNREALIIFKTDNNDKAVDILSKLA